MTQHGWRTGLQNHNDGPGHMLLELLTLQDAAACSHTDVVSAAATAFVQLTSQR